MYAYCSLFFVFAKSTKWFTINPSNTDGLKDGKSEKSHSTTGIIVKKLEDIQTTLRKKEKRREVKKKENDRHYMYMLFLFVILTSVTISRPTKKLAAQMKRRRNLRRCPVWKNEGYISEIDVTRASWYTNWNNNKEML